MPESGPGDDSRAVDVISKSFQQDRGTGFRVQGLVYLLSMIQASWLKGFTSDELGLGFRVVVCFFAARWCPRTHVRQDSPPKLEATSVPKFQNPCDKTPTSPSPIALPPKHCIPFKNVL